MNKGKLQFNLLLVALVIITSVLALTGLISANIFEQKYTENIIYPKVIKGQKLVSNIEYSLKYGKQLDNYFGMEDILQDWISRQKETDENEVYIQQACIILNNQNIAYGFNKGSRLEQELVTANNFASIGLGKSYAHQLFSDSHHIFLPITDKEHNWVGSLDIVFSDHKLRNNLEDFFSLLKKYLIYTIIVITIILAAFIFMADHFDGQGNLKKKRIVIIFIFILGLAQISYGLINYQLLKGAYWDISQKTIDEISQTISYDIEKIIDKGVAYNQIYHLEDYMNNILQVAPVVKGIQLGEQIYSVDKINISTDDSKSYQYNYEMDLKTDSKGKKPVFSTYLSEKYIKDGLRKIIIEMATILILAFFVMVEVVLFAGVYLNKKAKKNLQSYSSTEPQGDDIFVVRMLAFVVATVSYISVSFIPNVMNQLYEPIPNVPTELVLGLPISIVFFTGAVFSTVGGNWVDRFGWRKILYGSFICIIFSSFLSGLVKNPYIFILARGIHGIGYALVFITLRSYAVKFKSEEDQKSAISAINSGLYAGVNTGAVLGAMAMDKIGYEKVFFLGAVLMAAPILIALLLPKAGLNIEKRKSAQHIYLKKGLFSGLKIFKNFEVLLYLILICAPMAISILFVDYFVPTYAIKNNISVSDVGRAFLLNGIFVAYISPWLFRYLAKINIKVALVLARGLAALGYGVFALTGDLLGIFLAVSLLGLSDGLGNVYETEYYLNLKSIQSLGRGQALGYLATIRKLAQTLGPQIFAIGLTLGAVKGMAIIVMISLILTTIFALLGSKPPGKGEMISA